MPPDIWGARAKAAPRLHDVFHLHHLEGTATAKQPVVARRWLTPRMCGVGDAMMTGTNADTGTNPDREYIVEIAARPQRPYHAFVSHSVVSIFIILTCL